jgi:electron transfer flavoprotein beta subunit
MLNVAVCAKQIPNANAEMAFDPRTKTLLRRGPLVLDEADTFGIEMALRLVEQAGGGEVTLMSVSPNGETDGIRTAYAMGADKAILVSDPALGGLDALGTAKVLAAVAKRIGPDLILAATESTDGYTGTVPVQLAELLGLPAVSFTRSVQLKDQVLFVERQTEEGYEELNCPLPAVVTVTNGVVDVRYPSFRARMAAKTKPVEQLTVADLGLDPAHLGAVGARQEIVSIEGEKSGATAGQSAFASVFGALEESKRGNIITDNGDAHEAIIAALEAWKAL